MLKFSKRETYLLHVCKTLLFKISLVIHAILSAQELKLSLFASPPCLSLPALHLAGQQAVPGQVRCGGRRARAPPVVEVSLDVCHHLFVVAEAGSAAHWAPLTPVLHACG